MKTFLILLFIFITTSSEIFCRNINPNNKVSNDSSLIKKQLEMLIDSLTGKYKMTDDAIDEILLTNDSSYSFKNVFVLKRKRPINDFENKKYFIKLFIAGYEYKDTIDCNRAFNKLMNCFSVDCVKIKYKENYGGVKSIPEFILKTKREIISLSIGCEHYNLAEKEWEETKNYLRNIVYINFPKEVEISVGCGGPVIWK